VPDALTAGWAEKSALSSLVTMKSTAWPDSLGPAVMAKAQPSTDCGPASSFTASLAPLVKDGTSLMAVTVMVNVWGALVSAPPPLSWMRTVTVALPLALAAGV
jgi:hypothetical protein